MQTFCHCGLQVDLTYSVAKFLVEQARGNTHAPANPQEEDSLLIYNFHTTFTGKVSSCCQVSMTETAWPAVRRQLKRLCWALDPGKVFSNVSSAVQGNPSHPESESDFDECYFFEPYSDNTGIMQPASS